MDNLELEVKNILNGNERILSFYFSKKTKSAYFIIIKDDNKFITFRISNHSTNAFYSNRTFNIRKKSNQLLEEIRNYMDNSSWYNFKYQDYFGLKVVSEIPSKRMQLYIDNTMGIFDRSLGGLVFYQNIKFRSKNKKVNIVSETFQKELRKLFASGLISSSHREDKYELLVYITRLGKIILDYMTDKYKKRFKLDEPNINYEYIEVPKEK